MASALPSELIARIRAASIAAADAEAAEAGGYQKSRPPAVRIAAGGRVVRAPAYDRYLERAGIAPPPRSLSETPGLRISRVSNKTGASLAPTTPANRSEALRLASRLDELQAEGGSWERQLQLHDEVLAELVLQVGVHCAERGELLQRCRAFYLSHARWCSGDHKEADVDASAGAVQRAWRKRRQSVDLGAAEGLSEAQI